MDRIGQDRATATAVMCLSMDVVIVRSHLNHETLAHRQGQTTFASRLEVMQPMHSTLQDHVSGLTSHVQIMSQASESALF